MPRTPNTCLRYLCRLETGSAWETHGGAAIVTYFKYDVDRPYLGPQPDGWSRRNSFSRRGYKISFSC